MMEVIFQTFEFTQFAKHYPTLKSGEGVVETLNAKTASLCREPKGAS